MKPFSVPGPGERITPVAMKARATQQLHDRTGDRVVCLDGQVWITQHNDTRDIVLEPGQCFELDRPGLALVFALQDAVITVGAPGTGATPC